MIYFQKFSAKIKKGKKKQIRFRSKNSWDLTRFWQTTADLTRFWQKKNSQNRRNGSVVFLKGFFFFFPPFLFFFFFFVAQGTPCGSFDIKPVCSLVINGTDCLQHYHQPNQVWALWVVTLSCVSLSSFSVDLFCIFIKILVSFDLFFNLFGEDSIWVVKRASYGLLMMYLALQFEIVTMVSK